MIASLLTSAGTASRKAVFQATTITSGYAVLATLWILLSDTALGYVVRDPDLRTTLDIAKGWLFVAVTAALLFGVLLRSFLHLERAREAERAGATAYRTMFDANPHPMWVYDVETLRFLAVNDTAIRHYGYGRDEFLSMTLRDIRPRDEVPRLLANIARLGQGVDESGIWQHCKKNGELIDVEITSHTIEFTGHRAEVVLAHDITAARRAKLALAESEERLRLALAGSRQGLYDIDLVTGQAVTDAGFARMLGYDADDLHETMEAFVKRIHPEDRSGALDRYLRYISGRSGEYCSEFRLRCRDGSWKWVLSVGSIMARDAQGRPLRMIGTHTDITQQKQAEQRVTRLSRLYDLLSETNQAIMRDADPEAMLRGICRVAVERGGMKLAWIGVASAPGARIEAKGAHGAIGYLDPMAAAGSAPPPVPQPAAAALTQGQTILCNNLRFDPLTRDRVEQAREHGLGAAAALPLTRAGQVIGVLALYAGEAGFFDAEVLLPLQELAADISLALDNFALNEASRRVQEELRQSEERFRHLLQTLDDMVWSCSLDSAQMYYVNPAVERIYGVSVETFLADPRLWISCIHSEDMPRFQLAAERLLSEGATETEYRIVRPDGEVRWLRDRASVVHDENGRAVRLVGIASDITGRKQAEQALRGAQQLAVAIVQGAQEGVAVFGTDGRFRLWNPFLERATGRTANNVVGRLPEELFPDSAKLGIDDAIRRALAGDTVTLPEIPHVRPDGAGPRWLSAVHAPLRDEGGKVIGVIATICDITERRRAEQRSRLLSAAMEQSPASIVITDAQGRIEYVNPRFTEVTGYAADEVLGTNPRILKSGRYGPEYYRELSQTILSGRTWRGELCNRKKSGETYWEDASISPVVDAAGHVSHFLAVKEDISARKHAQDALQESRAMLRTVIDSVPMWIASFDRSGRYVVANRRYAETFGLPLDRIEGAHYSEVLPPALAAIHKSLLEECLAGRTVTISEAPPVSGTDLFVQGHYVPMTDSSGAIVGGVVAVTDVSELRRSEERLIASESRLSEAQRMAHICTWEHRVADGTLKLSDEGYRLLEVDPRSFGHTIEALFDAIHPQDRPSVKAGYARSLEDGMPFDVVHRLRMPDGRVKHVHTHSEPGIDPQGQAVLVLGTTQDISELKRAADEVLALNQKLERRVAQRTAELERVNQDLEAFSYSVSHDLRAPLRAINGFSHLALETDRERMSAEGRGLLERVVRNSDRMGRLIEDILAYSRAGRSAVKRTSIDLSALVQGVVEDLRPEYPRTEIVVAKLPVVSGDATMLRQVFANLLGNACKFSSRHTQPRVEVRCASQDDSYVIEVADNGAGFDMAYADKLFGMFQRMHTEAEFPGSGVGLAIVKRLVEKHGGRVWAESAPERGATFSFTLAAHDADARAEATAISPLGASPGP